MTDTANQPSETLRELLEILNDPKGMKSSTFATALQYVKELSDAELCRLHSGDASRGSASSVENELFRGVISTLIQKKGLSVETSQSLDFQHKAEKVVVGGEEFELLVVAPDKTTRAREDVFFSDYELMAKYSIHPLVGQYVRRIGSGNGATELPCKIVGLCFTDRVGMPMFLSSFKIEVSEADFKAYQLRSQIIPISEKSFRAPEGVWKDLLNLIRQVTEEKYGKGQICLRDFFVDAIKNQELFSKSTKVAKAVRTR